jgi:predicted DNA-binding protein (MmcQ/YjbR family)
MSGVFVWLCNRSGICFLVVIFLSCSKEDFASPATRFRYLELMDAERARTFLLALPHVEETQQWGDNLVFWVGDKAIGGKMFCLLNLDADGHGVISYAAGPERYNDLLEREGLVPAPYMARIFWVATKSWSVFRNAEWDSELCAAHELTLAKLPQRTRDVLTMPTRERDKLIRERRKLLAERAEAAKKSARKK